MLRTERVRENKEKETRKKQENVTLDPDEKMWEQKMVKYNTSRSQHLIVENLGLISSS
jgi:hypothetical protein